MVSRTTFASSSALIGCGKYAFKIDNSSLSFSASSARPPFSKLSMESWRCLTCLRMTCAASASFSSASVPDFAMAAYFKADLSMRRTPSFVVSLARMASFKSESKRSCNFMCAKLRQRHAIVDCAAAPIGPATGSRLTNSRQTSFYLFAVSLCNRLGRGRRDFQPARFIKKP